MNNFNAIMSHLRLVNFIRNNACMITTQIGDDDMLINITNNPNITEHWITYCQLIQQWLIQAIQGRRYFDLLNDIKFKRIKRIHRGNVAIPKILQAYLDFKVEVQQPVYERTSFMEPWKCFVYKNINIISWSIVFLVCYYNTFPFWFINEKQQNNVRFEWGFPNRFSDIDRGCCNACQVDMIMWVH